MRVVVLTARGPVFSSGGTLKHMQSLFDASPSALRQWYRQGIQRLTTALYNLEVPTIAAVPQHVEAVTAFVEKRKPVFGPE